MCVCVLWGDTFDCLHHPPPLSFFLSQAVHPAGRELALQRGANVLMPILTPSRYRADYALYEGKPCITDTAAGCEACLTARVASVGRYVAKGVAGDPPHARRRGGLGLAGVRVPSTPRAAHYATTAAPLLPRTNVAFVGAMNSGKSTALNLLAPGAAIVDDTPGERRWRGRGGESDATSATPTHTSPPLSLQAPPPTSRSPWPNCTPSAPSN